MRQIVPAPLRRLTLLLAHVFLSSLGILSAQTAFKTSLRFGDEAYFLQVNRIWIYDLESAAWRPAVPLTRSGATSVDIDSNGAVIAYGSTIYRYGTGFSGETLLATTSSPIESVFLDGNLVIAVHSSGLYGRVTSFDRSTGDQLSTVETYVDSIYGTSHAPDSNRLFGSRSGISPDDVVTASYTDEGILSAISDSPHHGDYPSSSKTWVFPNEARMVDDSGTVYSAPGLTYAGTFAGRFIDISFNGNVPVVLRENEVVAYGPSLLEAGRVPVTAGSDSRLHVSTDAAVIFTPTSRTPTVQTVPLSSLNAPDPGEPIDPAGLPYTIDDAFVDRDGNLLLFSKEQLSLFRWSPAERRYTGSFPLLGVPDLAAYSAENHSAYFAYASQTVRAMDLSAPEPVETPLFALPGKPHGLAAAGEFIMASDPSGAWNTHYVFSSSGEMIDSVDWNRYSRVWAWDPVKRRMYFFRDGTSPNDLHYEEIGAGGTIDAEGETPYHGDFSATPPIRVSPDGDRVVIGSGVVFETDGMTEVSRIPAFADAIWREDDLLTVTGASDRTSLTRWSASTFQALSTREFPGTPVRLLRVTGGETALVTLENGIPRIHLLDEALGSSYFFASSPVATEDLPYAWSPEFEWKNLGTGSLTFTAPVVPAWLRFSNGEFTGTPREADAGTATDPFRAHRVVIRATNSLGQSEQREFSITTQWVNDSPSLTGPFPELVADDDGGDIRFDLADYLSDPDADDSHAWSLSQPDNPSIFSKLEVGDDGILDIGFAPYVSGTATLVATVTDAAGESAEGSLTIRLPDLPSPSITLDSEPTLSRATGLYEQVVTVRNTAARPIAGFEVRVRGLRSGIVLYNGEMLDDSLARLVYARPMGPGETVHLTLEYHAIPRGDLPSLEIEVLLAEPPAAAGRAMTLQAGFAAPLEVTGLERLSDGSMALEFASAPGVRYCVEYSDDCRTWTTCPIPIEAAGTRVRWIDQGPPFTTTPPVSAMKRFYRVREIAN